MLCNLKGDYNLKPKITGNWRFKKHQFLVISSSSSMKSVTCLKVHCISLKDVWFWWIISSKSSYCNQWGHIWYQYYYANTHPVVRGVTKQQNVEKWWCGYICMRDLIIEVYRYLYCLIYYDYYYYLSSHFWQFQFP